MYISFHEHPLSSSNNHSTIYLGPFILFVKVPSTKKSINLEDNPPLYPLYTYQCIIIYTLLPNLDIFCKYSPSTIILHLHFPKSDELNQNIMHLLLAYTYSTSPFFLLIMTKRCKI